MLPRDTSILPFILEGVRGVDGSEKNLSGIISFHRYNTFLDQSDGLPSFLAEWLSEQEQLRCLLLGEEQPFGEAY